MMEEASRCFWSLLFESHSTIWVFLVKSPGIVGQRLAISKFVPFKFLPIESMNMIKHFGFLFVCFSVQLFLGWFVTSNQQPLPGPRINRQPMRDRRLSIHMQLLYPLNVKVFHRVSQEFPSRTESSLSKEAISLWTYTLFAFIYLLLYFLNLWLCFPKIHLSNKLLAPKSLSQGLLLQKFKPRVDPFLFCWFLYRLYLSSMLFIENSFSPRWWVVLLQLQINCLLIIIFRGWLFYFFDVFIPAPISTFLPVRASHLISLLLFRKISEYLCLDIDFIICLWV